MKKLLLSLTLVLCVALLGAFALADVTSSDDDVSWSEYIVKGSAATIKANAIDDATEYKIELCDIDNGWTTLYSKTYTKAGTWTIPASYFTNETIYAIRLSVTTPDETWTVGKYSVAVLPKANKASDGVVLKTNATTVGTTWDDCYCFAQAVGAEEIIIVLNNSETQLARDFLTKVTSFAEPGEYDLYAQAIYSDGSVKESEHITITAVSNGDMGAVPISVPDSLAPGKDLTIELKPVAKDSQITGDIFYGFSIWDITAEDDVFSASYSKYAREPGNPELGTGKTVTVPASTFTTGHYYQLGAWVSAAGWDKYTYEKLFVVPAGTDKKVTLTIEGQTSGTVEVPTHAYIDVQISAPGASFVRLWNYDYWKYPYEWWDDATWDPDTGVATIRMEASEDVYSASIYAQAYYGDYDEDTDAESLDWGKNISNIVSVSTYQEGIAPEITFSGMPQTVTQGDIVTIEVDGITEDVTGVSTWLRNGSSEDVGGSWWNEEEHTITLYTSNLEPGYYALCVYAISPGKANRDAYQLFKVVAPAKTPTDNFWVTLKNTRVPCYEEFKAFLFAPGASYFRFYDEETFWEDHWDTEYNGTVELSFNFEPGTYDLRFVAVYEDDEGNVTKELVSDPLKVTAYSLGVAPLSVQMASKTSQGTDIPVTIENLEMAQSCYMWVEDVENDYVTIWEMGGETYAIENPVVLPADLFEADHNYKFNINAERIVGYENWDYARSFRVTKSKLDSNLTLQLQVGGTEEWRSGTIEVPTGTWLNPRVKVDKTLGYTGVQIWTGEEWVNCTDDNDDGIFGGGQVLSWGNETRLVLARGTKDPIDDDTDWDSLTWGGTSNAVTVSFVAKGKTLVPDISVPATIAQGSLLPVTLTGGETATLWMSIHDLEGGEDYGSGLWLGSVSTPTTVYLDTGALTVGETYRINVDVTAKGKTGNGVYDTTFTVTKKTITSSTSVAVDVSATKLLPGEKLYVSAVAANENVDLEFFSGEESKAWERGKSAASNWEYFEEGTYDVYVVGHYDSGKEVTSNHVTVTVEGDGSIPKLTVPATVARGSTLDVVMDVTYWDANEAAVTVKNSSGEEVYSNTYSDVTFPLTMHIPTGDMTTGTYKVSAGDGTGTGDYIWSDEVSFKVVKPEEGEVMLGVDTQVPLVGYDFSVTAGATGAKKIRIVEVYSDGYEIPAEYDGAYVVTERNYWDTDPREIYAQAYVNNKWTDPTESIKIQPTSLGNPVVPEQTWPSILMKGDTLTYTFKKARNASWYTIDVYEWGGDYDQYADYEVEPGTNTYSTKEGKALVAGKIYSVGIDNWALGYGVVYPQHAMAVVDPAKIMTLPSGLKTIEEEAFANSAAQMIVVPSGVTSIESRAFADCPNLIAVVIPKSVKNVASDAFDGCDYNLVIVDAY